MSFHLLADDAEVLRAAAEWLTRGKRVALVTVLKTWGSSPRPPGSLLVIGSDGEMAGSVSGGCVEETLVARHRAGELGADTPTLVDFGVNSEEAARFGLPCGGRLELLIELLDSPVPVTALLAELEQHPLVARRLFINTGAVSLYPPDGDVEFSVTSTDVVKVFGPAWSLLLIGNGQIARHLASMAMQLDYRITICDPREAFIDPNPLPGVSYSQRMPDDEIAALSDAPRTAVVALAHDPKQDDLAMIAALESRAFYIGALGSVRTAAARCRRLIKLGYRAEQIARVHGPAGMPIGSKRPGEIALSILAGITAVRNGVHSSVDRKVRAA